MINVSGFKVWPAEVENMLYQHPDIREVAVYGLPDPVKGEKVAIAAVLRENSSLAADEIIQYCRDRLAVYKAPEVVQFAQLPKSATGTILKRGAARAGSIRIMKPRA